MDNFTDLVEKKKLFHRFQYPYTIHVSLDLSHDGEHQTTVQQWRREKRIGVGGFGKVFLEVLKIPQTSEVGQPAKYKFRAVKEIPKSGVTDQTYKRELKAIVNFSQEKVWVFSAFRAMVACANGSRHTDSTTICSSSRMVGSTPMTPFSLLWSISRTVTLGSTCSAWANHYLFWRHSRLPSRSWRDFISCIPKGLHIET